MKAKPDHFFQAFELCLNGAFSKKQAMVMAHGFSKHGLLDAQEGCMHYALRIMNMEATNGR